MLVCLQATAAEFDLNAVMLGKLKIGSAISVIQQQLPHCTFTKNERTEWGADGLFHQNWQSKSCGVEFDIVSDTKNSAQSISSMSIQSPSTLVTDRGVSIGSNVSDITSHYKNYVNSEESTPKKVIVIGSIYGGIQFFLQQDTVQSIFIGASAE
jgi:hypothetical protein